MLSYVVNVRYLIAISTHQLVDGYRVGVSPIIKKSPEREFKERMFGMFTILQASVWFALPIVRVPIPAVTTRVGVLASVGIDGVKV